MFLLLEIPWARACPTIVIAAVAVTPADTVLAVVHIAAAAGMDSADPLPDTFLVTERVLGVGSLAGRAHKLVVAGTLAVAADLPVMRPTVCRGPAARRSPAARHRTHAGSGWQGTRIANRMPGSQIKSTERSVRHR